MSTFDHAQYYIQNKAALNHNRNLNSIIKKIPYVHTKDEAETWMGYKKIIKQVYSLRDKAEFDIVISILNNMKEESANSPKTPEL